MIIICWSYGEISDWSTAETIEEAKEIYLHALEQTDEDLIYVFINAEFLTIEETKTMFLK